METSALHKLYLKQAEWTKATRNYLYRRAGIARAGTILEAGCGTGVILEELRHRFDGNIYGVDKDAGMIFFASRMLENVQLSVADGHKLPFRNGIFDIVICHYYLTWTADIREAVREICRVTRSGGFILAAAEPDYDGIIECPDLGIGELLRKALREEGIKHTNCGRRIKSILEEFADVIDAGIVSYSYDRNDFALLEDCGLPAGDLRKISLFFQPTFYVLAKK